ncbi:hypothetical protein V497_07790 [Pseudogymnoascus sp. VKM F-4516 (FW-969)]|nr:hypothetical protein V497_07790 [Pseudogymnoascus sp. VKM F-4516 (FW-969)]
MRSINARREADKRDPVEPWEYFDLIGGASTGGIIAIMLGRLRMPISECVEAYKELSRAIFTPNHPPESPIEEVEYLNGEGKFDSEAFEKAIKTQIQNSKVANDNDQILLQDTKSPCKVCVLALRENTSDPVIFRSYDYAGAGLTLFNKCKVWEACRATSASPTFFDPVQIEGRRFIDGGLGYNNPIFKVYDEARKIWKDRTIIATSIGTGEAPGTKFNGTRKQIAESIKKIITDCDRIADDFYNLKEDMVKEGRYFRLSVTHGLSNIGLEEHDHIGTITDHTEVYLSKGEPQAKLNLCTEALLQEHGNRISFLNSLQAPSHIQAPDSSATDDELKGRLAALNSMDR